MWKDPRSGKRPRLQGGDARWMRDIEIGDGAVQYREAGLRSGDFCRGGAEDLAFVGLLDEGDHAQVFGVGVGF